MLFQLGLVFFNLDFVHVGERSGSWCVLTEWCFFFYAVTRLEDRFSLLVISFVNIGELFESEFVVRLCIYWTGAQSLVSST